MHRSTTSPLRLLPLAWALSSGLAASHASAQSLQDLYTAARGYDASYQSAKSLYDANLAKAAQAKAMLLPSANFALGASSSNQDVNSPAKSADWAYKGQSAEVSVTQPLYRPANKAIYEQGMKQVDLAQAQLLAAEQNLIVQVSQAYFDVLASSDSLTFVKAQKAAVAEQLASAKRNFEVGTATITDTREAQARFDLVVAQELAADNDLRVKNIALNQLVGLPNATPKPLAMPVTLAPVEPADPEAWVQRAQDHHPALAQLKVALEVARLETTKAQAGHQPTLDLSGKYTAANSQGGSSGGPAAFDTRSNVATIGIAFNLPLFAGFATQNRIKETLALEDKARTDLEASRRTIAQATRTAFFGVQSGQAQVKAYEAAEASSQSALDANKLGYQVGVRINIDVLNSQSQLYNTKATLAKARYDVLVGGLKLKQAAGTLRAEDLAAINSQLAP
ncbi:MAG: TolC family outer membrane protein [Rhodoferax sp.]|nr:TolC family outer membrane protein [Rhodoferax sp.]